MKDKTVSTATPGETPGAAYYEQAGSDREKAEAIAGWDAICSSDADQRRKVDPDFLAAFYARKNELARNDAEIKAKRRRAIEQRCRGERWTFDIRERDAQLRLRAWEDTSRKRAAVEPSAISRAARPRPRGAGRPAVRGASRRSSARSGDSGSDSDSSEPPPAEGRRLCECGCGESIAHLAPQARFLTDTHRKRARRRHVEPPSYAEQAEPCVCDCGRAVLHDPDNTVVCLLCGRAKEPAAKVKLNGFDSTAYLMASNGVYVRRRHLLREWKTRPDRRMAARLRKTRIDRVDPSIKVAA